MSFVIRRAGLDEPQVLDLLALHLAGMRANSPAGSVHALDTAGLAHPAVTLWGVWRADALACIGALKHCSGGIGEIKSMRTHPGHLRTGAARALLKHIIHEAQQRGYAQLSLETGSGAAFEPALQLYRAHGFANGPAFGEYAATAFNQFLHLALDAPGDRPAKVLDA